MTEKTSLWSGRLDQNWNAHQHSFLRVGVSPSLETGIESTAQNQVFGQNAGSRTGVNQSRDVSGTFQHDTIFNDTTFNQFRFQFARRGLHFGFSELPGGSDIGVNIPGYAYFGREPYSTVDRIERRFQTTDNVTIVHRAHTFKLGVDVNFVQLRSGKQQIFELDYGGDVNFGGLAVSNFGLPNSVTLPSGQAVQLFGTTGLQSYGLGIPTTYIQGIGQSNQPFDNDVFAFFAQDSWRVNRKLTLNYGVREFPQPIRLQSRRAKQLHRLPARQCHRIRQPEIRNRQPAKIHIPAIIQLKNLLLPRSQLHEIHIHAQFKLCARCTMVTLSVP